MAKPHTQPVYVVDGTRTPFLKARGKPGPFSAAELAIQSGNALFNRLPLSPTMLDEVIMGSMMPSEDEANIARVIAYRLGCGETMPAWTVQRNCGSGMQALDCAYQAIASGRHACVLAGGTETMSRAPLIWQPDLVRWYSDFARAKTLWAKCQQLGRLSLRSLKPIVALLHGLSDPLVGLNMGSTVELMTGEYGICRERMDRFAVHSHLSAARAQHQGELGGVVPVYDAKGKCYERDDGIRHDSSVDALAALKPYVEKPYGLVTPGNSSQITDGAVTMLLASEAFVKEHQLPVLGVIKDAVWAAGDPTHMGLGPVWSSTKLLQRAELGLSDIDCWEINEAFAGQVLACEHVWKDPDYCKRVLGLDEPMGALPMAQVNVDGGAIAIGHPVGASGARIVLQCLHTMKRQQKKRGVATLCVGGGQGGAMLLESVGV